MSHQAYIDYLNSVKAANSATITANESAVVSYTSSISGLNDQIAAYESQITIVEAVNDQLAADNAMIDSIIALL